MGSGKLIVPVASLILLLPGKGEAFFFKIQPGESRVWFDAQAGLLGTFRGTSDRGHRLLPHLGRRI
ncbi:MAG: hypothetical protein ACK4Z6_05030 [Candidatus Methylomirabilales bacterium]